MDFIAPLAEPRLFWVGLIIALIGLGLIGHKKVGTGGTIAGYIILAGGVLLLLRSIYSVPSYATDAAVLIILLVAAITMTFKGGKWYVRVGGVVVFIIFYLRLKSVAPPGTWVGDLVVGFEEMISGLGSLISGG